MCQSNHFEVVRVDVNGFTTLCVCVRSALDRCEDRSTSSCESGCNMFLPLCVRSALDRCEDRSTSSCESGCNCFYHSV